MYIFWLAVSVIILVITVVVFSRKRSFSLFHPLSFYLMFHAIVFVIRPIFSVIYDYHGMYDAIGFLPNEWERSQVLICTNLGLIAFAVCSLSVGKDPIRFDSAIDDVPRLMIARVYWLPAIIIGALGLWSVLWLWSVADNFSEFSVRDSATGEGGLRGVSGYFLSMQIMLGILGAVMAWLGRFKLWSLVPIALFTVLQLGAGGRGQAVSGLTAFALLYLFDSRKRWPNASVVALFIVGAAAFNAVQADRGSGIRSALGLETKAVEVVVESKSKPLETMDLANMEFFEYIVWAVPKRTGSYDYFLSNLQIFTEPVPRGLWPDKPYGPPIKMFELYRYGKALGATSSVPGMGWIQWGYAGVVIWGALFGLFYGWMYNIFAARRSSALVAVAYMVFLSTSPVAFRDGAIVSIAKQMFFFLVPVIALFISAKLVVGTDIVQHVRAAGAGLTPRDRRRSTATGSARLASDTKDPMTEMGSTEEPSEGPSTSRERRLMRMRQLKAAFYVQDFEERVRGTDSPSTPAQLRRRMRAEGAG